MKNVGIPIMHATDQMKQSCTGIQMLPLQPFLPCFIYFCSTHSYTFSYKNEIFTMHLQHFNLGLLTIRSYVYSSNQVRNLCLTRTHSSLEQSLCGTVFHWSCVSVTQLLHLRNNLLFNTYFILHYYITVLRTWDAVFCYIALCYFCIRFPCSYCIKKFFKAHSHTSMYIAVDSIEFC